MGTADATPEFGRVSRVKGLVFEHLSLAASLFGILALAVLLVYVSVDAFDLADAEPAWTIASLATVVGPVLAFWLYSADDREVTRRVTGALAVGLVGSFAVVRGLEVAGLGIPVLDWALVFLFVIVVPVTGYTLYVGSQRPIGATGAGLLGRIVGGAALGLGIHVLFLVFDSSLWMLVYTLGVLPGVGLYALGHARDVDELALAAPVVGVLGFVAGVLLSNVLVFYVLEWVLYLWSIALPAAVLAAYPYYRDRGRRAGFGVGVAAFALPVVGSLAAGTQGIPPRQALLVLVPLVILPGLYTLRVVERGEGRLGLLAPAVILGGVGLATLVVGALGLSDPEPWLDVQFLTSAPSPSPEEAGLFPAIVGSIVIITLVAIISFVFGVGTAVFLEDYTSDEGLVGSIVRLIQVNIANLAAVPSVVYGLLGLALLANMLGTGYGTVVTISVTLSLLILPITIIAAQEAIRSVPDSLRRGSYAMGATRWQTTRNVVLPEALPGIFTGTILALGRAIGETAPLIVVGAATTKFSPPDGLWSSTTAMPMQIYAWYSNAIPAFRHGVLAAGIVTLLLVLLAMNGTAIVLRNRYERGEAS